MSVQPSHIHTNHNVSKLSLCLILLATGVTAPTTTAQTKRALDHDAYDIWNRVARQQISADGNWVTASFGPENEDGEVRVHHVDSGRLHTIDRGSGPAFSYDSRFLATLVKPPKDSTRQAKLDDKKGDDLPKDALAILDLRDGSVFVTERVKSFKLPRRSGGWIAYLFEKPLSMPDSTEADTAGVAGPEAQETAKKETETVSKTTEENKDKKSSKAREKKTGTGLVLRELRTGQTSEYRDVLEYAFSEDGRWLAYTASSKDSTSDGVSIVETTTGEITALAHAPGWYHGIVFSKTNDRLAFLGSPAASAAGDQHPFSVYYWQTSGDATTVMAESASAGIPDGWWVGEHGTLSFSDDGRRLFFGTAPRPEDEPDDDDRLDEEEVVVDVWSWTDPYFYPQQLNQLETEKKRTYTAVVEVGSRRITQLATQDIPTVDVGSDGDAAVGIANSNMPYRQEISWDSPNYNDVYVVDVATGDRRLVVVRLQSSAALSPQAKYAVWWDRDALAWFVVPTTSGKPRNVTGDIPHAVHNELHDWPYKPSAYGTAGWTDGDESLLIYDMYDIWSVDPEGRRAPKNVTGGTGRREGIRFRYIRLDPEQRSIDPNEPLMLSAFHPKRKEAGYYDLEMDSGNAPKRLIFDAHRYANIRKAELADRLLYTREDFSEFPDMWVGDRSFRGAKKVSNSNPQQRDYLWGTAELTEWTSTDGELLQGLLYKPEGFDPTKRYPMMVYFYEKNSDNLFRHYAPEAHRSIINITFYVSRGYVVFVPDIPYKTGYPGESAMNAVMPGVATLIQQGFVDQDRIGVQGHSWGGYQIAYMVTQTNLFRAAEAGAPVANMISAYGGVRWGTGMSRMFQYERTQSRIGGSLWDYPLRYIHNSPIFQADKIQTPLLIMHNDHDGAVPWYQGIELFAGLRRLGQPVWLVNYNGEPHWPTKFQNKRDWQIRMQQYFDHYLQDAPMPEWMKDGIPAIRKGETLGLDPAVDPGVSAVEQRRD